MSTPDPKPARRGENCRCGRWNPYFAEECYGLPLRPVLVARMADYFERCKREKHKKK